MSTLMVSPTGLSAREDAISLHKAFKGFGCDTGKVIKILAHRDATQRAFIQREYKAMYGEELEHRLCSELSGNLEKAIILWIHGPAERDALIVRKALSGDVVDLRPATEVICSRTSSQIQAFKQVYRAKFGGTLEDDIRSRLQGDHQKDTRDLYRAGEKRLGTDEATFIRIFSERSYAHLAAIDSLYERMNGSSLEKVVKKETSQNFEFELLTVLRCAKNPGKYFAKELYKAMKGMGTNDSTLIRIVVSRTEIDMAYIKAEYQKMYGKSLSAAICSETSGHYRDFLLSLVDPAH